MVVGQMHGLPLILHDAGRRQALAIDLDAAEVEALLAVLAVLVDLSEMVRPAPPGRSDGLVLQWYRRGGSNAEGRGGATACSVDPGAVSTERFQRSEVGAGGRLRLRDEDELQGASGHGQMAS